MPFLLARAVIGKPSILMLDESTSALDTNSERIVQKALESLSKQQTTLMIAHRLSTVRNVDRILVIDQGKLIESGSHEELMRKRGLYYVMVQAQQLAHETEKIEENIIVEESSSSSSDTSLNTLDKSFRRKLSDSFTRVIDDEVNGHDRSLSLQRSGIGSLVTSLDRPTKKTEILQQPSDDEDEKIRKANEKKLKKIQEKEHKRLMQKPFPIRRIIYLTFVDMRWVILGLVGSIFDGTVKKPHLNSSNYFL